MSGKNAGRGGSSGTGTNDRDADHVGNPAGGLVSTCIPSATGVVQARTREWSASQTQQSWQAPIRQNPARISSLNSWRRKALRAISTASRTLSPACAKASSPSMRMRTFAPSGTIARASLPVMIVFAASVERMLAEHAAPFNGAFDSHRTGSSICGFSEGAHS